MSQPLESIPPIIAPIDIDFPFAPVIVPERGEKNKILLMMKKNLMEHKFKSKSKVNQDHLEQIQKDLRLTTLPKHIECFDNSNIQEVIQLPPVWSLLMEDLQNRLSTL